MSVQGDSLRPPTNRGESFVVNRKKALGRILSTPKARTKTRGQPEISMVSPEFRKVTG